MINTRTIGLESLSTSNGRDNADTLSSILYPRQGIDPLRDL